MEPREITALEQHAILVTSETPGFRLLLDCLQAEIDYTLGLLDNFHLTDAEEKRLLSFVRAYRHILFHFIHKPKALQLALRQEVDPQSTTALFTPGISEGLDVEVPEEDPLAPSNSNVVVE